VTCGRQTKVAETRGVRRRRVCACGAAFHTVEVPERMWMRVFRIDAARHILRIKGYLV
jgi:transcriptional regulator NrdR family protein